MKICNYYNYNYILGKIFHYNYNYIAITLLNDSGDHRTAGKHVSELGICLLTLQDSLLIPQRPHLILVGYSKTTTLSLAVAEPQVPS